MPHDSIYAHLVGLGIPVILPEPWQRFRCDPAFFRIPADHTGVLAGLESHFAAAELIAAGVAQHVDDGTLTLNPALLHSILWGVRRQAKGPPWQLMADMQSLAPKQWSFSAALSEHRTARLIRDAGGQIVVAFSMTDLALLRSLGIAAVPSTGLQNLRGVRWPEFRRLMHLDAEEAQTTGSAELGAEHEGVPRNLTLLDCSLATLATSESPAAESLWNYFQDLKSHLGLELFDYRYLKLSAADLAKLRFCAEHGCRREARDAILYGSLEVAASTLAIDRPLPDSLAAALRGWRRAYRRTVDAAILKQTWEDVLDVLERDLLEPLSEQARRTVEPVERSLLASLASFSRMLQPQLLATAEQVAQAAGERRSGPSSLLASEDLQQLLIVSDRVLALTQGIHACRRKRPLRLVGTPSPQRLKMSSKASDSAPKKSPPSVPRGF